MSIVFHQGTAPVPFLIHEDAMTALRRSNAKAESDQPAGQAKGQSKPSLIVFGLDEYERPKAGWFADADAERANAAAQRAHLNTLKVGAGFPKDLLDALPPGRVHASGAVVPHVRRDVYDKVRDRAGPLAGQGQGLPKAWDDVDVGHVVIAYENSEEGWWEAVVVDRKNDMLTLRWRDYPKQPPVTRHRHSVALLKPAV